MVSCLLIEHNDEQRSKLAAMVSGLGIECTSVADPEEGVAALAKIQPDVVLMDAKRASAVRPFLRGRNRSPGQREPALLVYSRSANMDVIGETILNGAAEFLMLPFDRDLLRFKLKQSGVLPMKAA